METSHLQPYTLAYGQAVKDHSWMMAIVRVRYLSMLGIYIYSSIKVTQLNKDILSDYPYPWMLTALHILSTFIGARFFQERSEHSKNYDYQENLLYIIAFAALYTLNIAVSHVSLNLSTLSYHQTIRILSIHFTSILSLPSRLLSHNYSPWSTLSLFPIMYGITNSHSDQHPADSGPFWLNSLGALLASIKSLATHAMQKRIGTAQLLSAVCPIAFMQALIWAQMNGEVDEFIVKELRGGNLVLSDGWVLAFSAFSAVWLNWISFTVNGLVGPLSMAVAGTVKHVLVIWNVDDAEMSTFAFSMILGGTVMYTLGEVIGTVTSRRFRENLRGQIFSIESPV